MTKTQIVILAAGQGRRLLPLTKSLPKTMLKVQEVPIIDHILDSIDINLINMVIDLNCIDLVQVPINILDQRLIFSGLLEKLNNKGIEIHARSIFLQGLLLIDPEDLSPYFESIREHLKKYRLTLKKHKIKPVQAALNFISNIQEIDVMLCGVRSHAELEDIISSLRKSTPLDFTPYAIDDSLILNPSNWDDRIY